MYLSISRTFKMFAHKYIVTSSSADFALEIRI